MKQHEKDTQDCLALEDNKSALVCLKKIVAQYSGSNVCRPKLILLVRDGCVPCKEETALHADDIARGIIKKIDIDSPKGLAIARENNISLIPSLVLLDCHNKLIMPV